MLPRHLARIESDIRLDSIIHLYSYTIHVYMYVYVYIYIDVHIYIICITLGGWIDVVWCYAEIQGTAGASTSDFLDKDSV